jgi:hypothetical protein
MSSHKRVGLAFLVGLTVCLGGFGVQTSALAETPQDYETSVTVNDHVLPDPVLPSWIWWSNTPRVALTFAANTTATIDTTHPVDIGGFAYVLDHSLVTSLSRPGDTSTPVYTAYAPAEDGSTGDVTPIAEDGADLNGWVHRLTTPYWIAGMHDPIEGVWYLHAHTVTARWDSIAPPDPAGKDTTVHFGIDVTPPSSPTHLNPVGPIVNGNTVNSSVCDFTWDNPGYTGEEYDTLSGDAKWRIYLNDTLVRTFRNVLAWPEGSATMENLEPGKNTVQVSVIDYAGNESERSTFRVYSDPDTPTVSITSPSGSYIGVKPTLTATASDVGGVASVVFKVDGIAVGTFTSAPYSGSVDLSSFAAGSHSLSATVTDRYGRQVTVSKTVTLDKIPLVLNSFSRTPKTFYPIRREGYYDNSYIRFKLNKDSNAKLTIKNSSGTTVKTLYKTARAATYETIKWDGKWSSDGKAHVGTYYYYLTATDAAANSVASSRLTTYIKNYQLVRSGGGVKVIRR